MSHPEIVDTVVTLAHGAGGRKMRKLIEHLFLNKLSNEILCQLGDSAVLDLYPERKTAFTTDSYVVKPLFFPGGDIGRLAVCGTVNDLAMAGAVPLFLSLSMIIEEGFPMSELEEIVGSIQAAAAEANVQIVTGDTKVVEKGAADGIFINTSGVGTFTEEAIPAPRRVEMGDAVIVNGFLGDHGVSILHARGDYDFHVDIASDVAPLSGMIGTLSAYAPDIHFMRDLTRGGLAAGLNELAVSAGKAIEIEEDSVPIREEVLAVCNLLGLDPYHIANEAKCIIVCSPGTVEQVLEAVRRHPYGTDACRIGTIVPQENPLVVGRTALNARRVIGMPSGRLLPRIC